jgi:hypothetical protein
MDHDKMQEALQQVQHMSREDVLAELRKHGINDLNDLVDASLDKIQGDEVQGYMEDDDGTWSVVVYTRYLLAWYE